MSILDNSSPDAYLDDKRSGITSTSPASNYVGINQSITYGTSKAPILNTTAGIVDTGTTLLLIATGIKTSLHACWGLY